MHLADCSHNKETKLKCKSPSLQMTWIYDMRQGLPLVFKDGMPIFAMALARLLSTCKVNVTSMHIPPDSSPGTDRFEVHWHKQLLA